MILLTADQKAALEQQLRKAREAFERNRLCVILGHNNGIFVGDLVKELRLSRATVTSYLNDFDSQQNSKNDPRGGTHPRLTFEQSQALSDHLDKTTYLNVKFICEYDSIDAEAIIDFLPNLEHFSKAQKIHMILDNAKSNKNKKLNELMSVNPRLELHYLPPYSPNLNPIERLWKIMRKTKLYNRHYESSAVFFHGIRNFFREDISKMVDVLTSSITDKFQAIMPNPIMLANIC